MADFMMLFMLTGGVGGAIKNNGDGPVRQACKNFNDAQKTYNDTLNKWKGILQNGLKSLQEAQDLNVELESNKDAYKLAAQIVHDEFRKREQITMVMIAIFVFSIIITFLLRYFNVYSNIWSFFVNKK
jgi:hypothetical protein